jgi:hypothetical protein
VLSLSEASSVGVVLSRLRSVRLLAVAVVVGLLVLGGALAWAIESGASGSRSLVTKASNQRAAARDDHLLLSRLALPGDARRSAREPTGGGSTLTSEGPHTASPDVIDRRAWWVVPRPELAVLAFVNAHIPAGSHIYTSGWGSRYGIRTSSYVWFQWPAIKSVLYERKLVVQLAPLPNGSTGVRADAEDVWEMPMLASEQIPSSARVLDVFVVPADPFGRHPIRRAVSPSPSITVTDTAKVSKIAAMIDHLATRQPVASTCLAQEGEGPFVVFNFRATQNGPVLAQASKEAGPEGPCEPMHLWIHKHKQTPLAGGYSVIQETEKLLHVTLH